MKEKNKVGEKIKELRENAGLTVTETAKKLQISRQTLNNWEKGKNLPSPELIYQLCGLFGVSVEKLLGYEFLSNRDCINADNPGIIEEDKVIAVDERTRDEGCIAAQTEKSEQYVLLDKELGELKAHTAVIREEINKAARNRKIIATALLAMLCTAVLLVAAFAIILIVPILTWEGNDAQISTVIFGISSASDVLLIIGIVFAVVATGVVCGFIYAVRNPLKAKKEKKD